MQSPLSFGGCWYLENVPIKRLPIFRERSTHDKSIIGNYLHIIK